MKTLEDLRELRDRAGDDWVLSVYLASGERDPAMRAAWRVRLDGLLDEARPAGGVHEPDTQAFDAARQRLERELASFTGFLPGAGWAGFATADEVLFAGEVPAPMPDLVRWRRGALLGPYLRALKQARPVVVVAMDSRRARLFTYQGGRLQEVADLRADHYVGDVSDGSVSKRAASHSGVRGETATEAATRPLETGTRRLLEHVRTEVGRLAGGDGLVIVGAPEETGAAARRQLEPICGGRLLEDPALHVGLPDARVEAAAAAGASSLAKRLQADLVSEIVDAAGAAGRGCLGDSVTERALRQAQVDTLALSAGYMGRSPDRAEELVDLALDSGASVEYVVDGEGARGLDENGGGVGARLRYAPAASRREEDRTPHE